MKDPRPARVRNAEETILDLHAEIERYERGLRKIKEYLEVVPPRVGDATFTIEALLAR